MDKGALAPPGNLKKVFCALAFSSYSQTLNRLLLFTHHPIFDRPARRGNLEGRSGSFISFRLCFDF